MTCTRDQTRGLQHSLMPCMNRGIVCQPDEYSGDYLSARLIKLKKDLVKVLWFSALM